MERIDLHLNIPSVEIDKLIPQDTKHQGEISKAIRKRVSNARKLQEKRFRGTPVHSNAGMKNKQIKTFCELDIDSKRLLKTAADSYQLSARSYFRIIKVARTIADLADEKQINTACIAEALQYRFRFQEK